MDAGYWNIVSKWWKFLHFSQHCPAAHGNITNRCSEIWVADEGLRILFFSLAFPKCQAGLEWRLSPPRRIRNILQQTSTTGPAYTQPHCWMRVNWFQTCECNPSAIFYLFWLKNKTSVKGLCTIWHPQNLFMSEMGSTIAKKASTKNPKQS